MEEGNDQPEGTLVHLNQNPEHIQLTKRALPNHDIKMSSGDRAIMRRRQMSDIDLLLESGDRRSMSDINILVEGGDNMRRNMISSDSRRNLKKVSLNPVKAMNDKIHLDFSSKRRVLGGDVAPITIRHETRNLFTSEPKRAMDGSIIP